MVTEQKWHSGEPEDLLGDKDEGSRIKIAQRTGELLSLEDLPSVAREATESLARQLMTDALERVRSTLAAAVRHARYLPRDIALKLAHDVDAVACPFLEATEVFSESDWQQIVLTVSRTALKAIAVRPALSEGIALAVASTCDSDVAESLIDNPAAPMTGPICEILLDRFAASTWVLDRLAQRDDLFGDIAVRLTTMVSAAAREKLNRLYRLTDYAEPVIIDAEDAALLQIVRNTSEARLPRLVKALQSANKLSHSFLLMALRENLPQFVLAAMSDLAGATREEIATLVERNDAASLAELTRKAGLPSGLANGTFKALSDRRPAQ